MTWPEEKEVLLVIEGETQGKVTEKEGENK